MNPDPKIQKPKNPKYLVFEKCENLNFFGWPAAGQYALSCFPCGVAYDCRLSTIENVGSLIYNYMESYNVTLYHWITIALAKISAIVPVIYDPVFGNCIFQAYKLEF